MAELMKGNVWHERKDAKDRKGNPIVTYPVIVEDKNDEIRCHVKIIQGEVYFLSYAGKPLANMECFASMFLDLSRKSGYLQFDCGFEVNGNFDDSYRWVRSTKNFPIDLEEATWKFYWYDIPTAQEVYAVRREIIAKILRNANIEHIHPLQMSLAHTPEQVDQMFYAARAAGKEGIMVKQLAHLYMPGKRTDGWLKMKPEDDADGVIVQLIEATATVADPENGVAVGDPLGRIGSVLVHVPDGSEARPHGIGHALGRDMYLHPRKYLGQWCEFKFMERDRQGGYRHPTFHRLREAK